MNFGIPKQRESRQSKELFPNTPVLTITAQEAGDEGSKKSRPMKLNTKAVELLGLGDDARIAFSFENGTFITNGDNDLVPEEHRLRVTKGYPRKINDKKTVTYMSKVGELDNSVENHFGLVQVTPDGDPIILFGLQLIQDGQPDTYEVEIKEEDVVSEKSDDMELALGEDTNESPQEELKNVPSDNEGSAFDIDAL